MATTLHLDANAPQMIAGAGHTIQERAASHERQPLLADEETGSVDAESRESQNVCPPNPFASLPVYSNIWRIRRDVVKTIKDPYSEDQLRAPRLNTTIVRPYLEQLYAMNDASLVYCLLVNRVNFLREQVYDAGGRYQSVHTSRATFCSIIASKLLRAFDEDNSGRKGLLLLANILIAGFEPFQNAPLELSRTSSRVAPWLTQDRGGYENKMTALEVAIISDAKMFLSVPSCQKVIDAIYVGRIVYSPTSFIDIIPDHYRHRPISIYEPSRAAILNQYRLVVPRTRKIIEIFQFVILLILYFLFMTHRKADRFTFLESVFCAYTFGWLLDLFATILEHGWSVYSQNLWSFLDVTYGFIYVIYFAMRMRGLATHSLPASRPALHIIALAGPLLVPRLAFNIFSESILFVALRDMMASFFFLTLLAVWSFAGFLLAMIWLGEGAHTPVTVMKWMIWIWFGLDGTGIQRSIEFHWLLGPILMISFAFLGNTLFLTIVVSTLSNTFSRINSHSTAEVQFRRTVLTFEGVKSDAIFYYPPPFNILALLFLLPLKMVLSPRWFHKINITIVRVLNAPMLLLVNWYERKYLWPTSRRSHASRRNRSLHNNLSRFEVHGDIQAVFDAEPTESMPEYRSQSSSSGSASINSSGSSSSSRSGSVDGREANNASPAHANINRLRERKDSTWLNSDNDERMKELLDEYAGGEDFKTRLKALESTMGRVEEMIRGLCKKTDEELAPPESADPST